MVSGWQYRSLVINRGMLEDTVRVRFIQFILVCFCKVHSRMSITYMPDAGRACLLACRCDQVAVFACRPAMRLSFQPIGAVVGPRSADQGLNVPTAIEFQNRFRDGAMLMVCWSQGQITAYPLLFKTSS